ncbi:hypothetical protein TeGR_g3866 [Tetraparma gracilis]|uniref:VTT domain-containing protein n=1 Tax=Tetraparma gracilis TaxID=2962635 RepID=A0ABQ6N3X2_9STRA|nr:hypothetical protein TeGR_g3866 [Tetraparma gracilis]
MVPPAPPPHPTLPDPPPKKCSLAKVVTAVVLVAIVTYVIVDSLTSKNLSHLIEHLITWIEHNPIAGMVVFALVYIAATVLFIPGSLLTIGAGLAFSSATGSALYGTLLGSVSVFFGASAGSILAFVLARYLLRDSVMGYLAKQNESGFKRTWNAVDRAMSTQGLKIMFLLRLSPLIPFNALNYVAGTTGITLRDYCVSMFGILPGTVLFVYIGALSSDIATAGDEDSGLKTAFLVVGGVAGFVGVAIASWYAKKELNASLAVRDGDGDGDGDGVGVGSKDASLLPA